jgi:glycosyltransferase involved in cell wall biosynthesis
MPKILKKRSNTKLIIGGTGSDMPRLKNRVSELGLSQRIIFTGYIPSCQVPVFFSLATLFAFHSTYETFGIVLAEAMNYRKAIVSVSNTAIKEIVDNKKNGILVPTFSQDDFADAVIELLKDNHKRHQMGKEGKNKVNRLFQWDLIASKYEAVLEAASSGNKLSN